MTNSRGIGKQFFIGDLEDGGLGLDDVGAPASDQGSGLFGFGEWLVVFFWWVEAEGEIFFGLKGLGRMIFDGAVLDKNIGFIFLLLKLERL